MNTKTFQYYFIKTYLNLLTILFVFGWISVVNHIIKTN